MKLSSVSGELTMKGDILIVDHQLDSLNLLNNLLLSQGYEVRTATSGSRALQAVASHPPDLVLLDIHLPGMDSLQVCRRLKVDSASAAVPVLFLGAQFDLTDKLAAFAAGGQDFIARPFVAAELLARVRCHLRLYQRQRDLEVEVEQAVSNWGGAYDALQNLSQRWVDVGECQRRHRASELHKAPYSKPLSEQRKLRRTS